MHSHYCKLDSVQSCLIEIWHWLLKQQWRWKHLLLFAYVLASFNMFSWSLCVCSRNEEIYNVGASPSSSRISLKWVLNFLINLCCQLYNYKVQGVTMNYIRQQHLWSRDWRFWRRRIWSILLKCCDAPGHSRYWTAPSNIKRQSEMCHKYVCFFIEWLGYLSEFINQSYYWFVIPIVIGFRLR